MLAVTACGGEDGNNGFIPGNNKNDAGDTADMGDDSGDVAPDMGQPDLAPEEDMGRDDDIGPDPDMSEPSCDPECGPGETCRADGTCGIVDSCAAAIDLGVLPTDADTVVPGTLAGGVDLMATTCGTDPMGRERIIRFELAQDSLLQFTAEWQGQYDGVVEFRSDCETEPPVEDCSDIETGSRLMSAGTYFMVLETRFGNPGAFEVTLRPSPTVCTPGTRECVDGDLVVCSDPLAPATYACSQGCENGTCTGSTCDSAITVNDSVTVTGDGNGYTSTLNFTANADCGSLNTPGYEVVFYLPGLSEDDVVSIDAATNDVNINRIFVLPVCGDTAACLASYTVEVVDWVVPADGDYYIVIDKLQASSTPFEYTVTRM